MERAGGEKVGYVQLYEFGGFASATCAATWRRSTEQGRAVVHPRPALQRRRAAHAGGRRDRHLPDGRGHVDQGSALAARGARDQRPGGHRASRSCCSSTATRRAPPRSSPARSRTIERAEVDRHAHVRQGPGAEHRALGNGAALKLTTAVYLTPNGTDINKKGITPDIVVRRRPEDEEGRAAPGRAHVPHRTEVGARGRRAATRERATGGRASAPRTRAAIARGARRARRTPAHAARKPLPYRVARWGKFWSLEPLFADDALLPGRQGRRALAARRSGARRAVHGRPAPHRRGARRAPTTSRPCCAPCSTRAGCRRASRTRCSTRRPRCGARRAPRPRPPRPHGAADVHHRPRHGARLRRRHQRGA